MIHFLWHLIQDTDIWDATLDLWHNTHGGGVNIHSKFQLRISYVFGMKAFWRFQGKGSLTELGCLLNIMMKGRISRTCLTSFFCCCAFPSGGKRFSSVLVNIKVSPLSSQHLESCCILTALTSEPLFEIWCHIQNFSEFAWMLSDASV